MTYRDDHDAALQRAAALEAELARAKAERDKAVTERDRLANALEAARAKPPVETRIVVVREAPLTSAECDHLATLLGRGANVERGGYWFAATLGGMFGVLGILGIFAGSAQMAVSGLFLALLLGGLSTVQLVSNGPDRWRPVLDAVRDHPDQIITVRRIESRRGWTLVVKTQEGELSMSGDTEVLRLLQRHCPGARFDG